VQARLRWFRVLLAAVLFVLGGGTTSASAATFTYDVPTLRRVDVQQIEAAEALPTRLAGAPELSASPSTRRHLATVTPPRAPQPLMSRAERRRLECDQQRRRNA
jgi:hypothetical protein